MGEAWNIYFTCLKNGTERFNDVMAFWGRNRRSQTYGTVSVPNHKQKWHNHIRIVYRRTLRASPMHWFSNAQEYQAPSCTIWIPAYSHLPSIHQSSGHWTLLKDAPLINRNRNCVFKIGHWRWGSDTNCILRILQIIELSSSPCRRRNWKSTYISINFGQPSQHVLKSHHRRHSPRQRRSGA